MRREDEGEERGGNEPPRARLPVFYDPENRRRRIIRPIALLLLFSALGWLIGFGLSLYMVEKLPQPPTLAERAGMPDAAGRAEMPRVAQDMAEPPPALCAGDAGADAPAGGPEVFAYLPFWPEWTFAALRRACARIDVLMPQWHRVDAFSEGIRPFDRDTEHQHYIREILAGDMADTPLFPVIEITEAAWAEPDSLSEADFQRLAREVENLAAERAYDGICIAPSEVPAPLRPAFVGFLADLDARLGRAGRQSCVILRNWMRLLEQEGLARSVDRVVLIGFDTPWIGSAPAPLAGQAWFEQTVRGAIDRIGKDKLVVAIGSLAYDWSSGNAVPELIGFPEAMRRAARFGGAIGFAEDALNTRITFADDSGERHEVWLLDGVSAFNQLATLERLGLGAMAVWSLGLEDPTVWRLLDGALPPAEQAAGLLASVRLEDYVGYEGTGAFRHLLQTEAPGRRSLAADPARGLLTGQEYEAIPTPYTIQRFGRGGSGEVALSFDDGPDPRYTGQILDILKEKQAPATFFVVGRNILRSPELLERIVDEGHDVGSHTFFHPELEEVSDYRTLAELNALQRLIASITGRRTLLFRTPYGRGEGPLTGADARPMAIIGGYGHVVVGSDIVPPDWTRPTAQEIVDHVRRALAEGSGNVIVMHDAGGDRAATVEALPGLIDMLREDGYRIVPLGALMGVDRDVLMPVESGVRPVFDGFSFSFISLAADAIGTVFWVVVLAGAARATAMLVLAHFRRHYPPPEGEYLPPVTVVIPAYNEEVVIVDSIRTVLESDYPDLRVIVVDDGSSDHTFDAVLDAFPDERRITLISEPNQGKWRALDTAYGDVESEIVVAIDADTVVAPDAIRRLVAAFRDPRVGAVSGNVKVGNRGRLLTRLQALEYITAQNIDRRAMESLNAMLVVPGAIGAWRAQAVRDAGLYTNQTVAEDADLTVAVIRAGYRVRFEEHAYSITEAPENVGAFLKQRLRWTFGMMQTAWKHRGAALEGRAIGLVSIPDLAIFGVLLPLLAPLADLIFIGAVIDYLVDTALGRPAAARDDTAVMIFGYLALPLLDLVAVLLALRFEKGESARLLWLIPLQRFFYRQLLYITVYRALIRAVLGQLAAWGKLVRTGNLRLRQP